MIGRLNAWLDRRIDDRLDKHRAKLVALIDDRIERAENRKWARSNSNYREGTPEFGRYEDLQKEALSRGWITAEEDRLDREQRAARPRRFAEGVARKVDKLWGA